MTSDPYANPNADQEALDSIHAIREAWKARQPDPQSSADVMELGRKWRASPEAEECRHLLGGMPTMVNAAKTENAARKGEGVEK